MSTENAKIECFAKPITHAFIYFKDHDERNKYVRSANLLRKELRGRKVKEFVQRRLGLLDQNVWSDVLAERRVLQVVENLRVGRSSIRSASSSRCFSRVVRASAWKPSASPTSSAFSSDASMPSETVASLAFVYRLAIRPEAPVLCLFRLSFQAPQVLS